MDKMKSYWIALYTEINNMDNYKNYSNEIITRSKTKKLRRNILMKKIIFLISTKILII